MFTKLFLSVDFYSKASHLHSTQKSSTILLKLRSSVSKPILECPYFCTRKPFTVIYVDYFGISNKGTAHSQLRAFKNLLMFCSTTSWLKYLWILHTFLFGEKQIHTHKIPSTLDTLGRNNKLRHYVK